MSLVSDLIGASVAQLGVELWVLTTNTDPELIFSPVNPANRRLMSHMTEPVQTPDAASNIWRTHVFPEPGKLTSPTGGWEADIK